MIDDEGRIDHLALVESLCTDAVFGDFEDAVAAVFAAAHDEVGNDSLCIVLAAAQNDAAAGISMIGEDLLHFHNLHGDSPVCKIIP